MLVNIASTTIRELTLTDIAWFAGVLTALGGAFTLFFRPISGIFKKINNRLDQLQTRADATTQDITAVQQSIKESQEDRRALHEEITLIGNGTKSVLGAQVIETCTELIRRGRVTVPELQALDSRLEGYQGLKGNGVAETLARQVKQLPIVDINMED